MSKVINFPPLWVPPDERLLAMLDEERHAMKLRWKREKRFRRTPRARRVCISIGRPRTDRPYATHMWDLGVALLLLAENLLDSSISRDCNEDKVLREYIRFVRRLARSAEQQAFRKGPGK